MTSIHSRENPLFRSLRRLVESGRERQRTGRTVLDSLHLVAAYEDAMGPVARLIVSESALLREEISAYLGSRPRTVFSDALMRELGVVDTPSGLLALIPLPATPAAVDPRDDAVFLEGIQDPGNVGTILRTAAAAGVQQIALSPGCAAVWSPRVLRAGQGAHFRLRLVEQANLVELAGKMAGSMVVTTLQEATDLFAADLSGPLVWVFGSEGQGVSTRLCDAADLRVRIGMASGVESLNVAAAAAICLFEVRRQRAEMKRASHSARPGT